MKVGVEIPGVYQVVLDTDSVEFEGHGRIDHSVRDIIHKFFSN